jgi:hypothetical protein
VPADKLAIRRLTLYKHGVGFVEREGQLSESEVQLVFRQAEVNDALKSLLVIDQGGGQVRGIHYETPIGNFADERRIDLSPDHSLLDLLRSLRGRTVRLVIGEGTTAQEYTGQLLGVEIDPERPLSRSLVALLLQKTGEGSGVGNEVISLALPQLRALYLLEERAAQDLRFFLDSSRNDEAHRTVTLQLDENKPEHNLFVSYLVPFPTWRVSYRLVAESDKDEQPESVDETKDSVVEDRKGELLLQGWGLFDNRLEEDLENVSVRLVAGQPISFIYDLASSRIPERPTVLDEARVASGPVEFAEPLVLDQYDAFEAASAAPMPVAAPMMARSAAPRPPAQPSYKKEMSQQTAQAKASAMGELFQYEVTTPVTVRRGESALVPIISNTLPYNRELLYNGQKMPENPVAALRFKNTTGLVLERGPVTIVEDGEYKGEALVSFSPAEAEVYLAYAVELGIKVTENVDSRTETMGIRLDREYLYFNQATIRKTSYTIENRLTQTRVVTIEKPIDPNYNLLDTAPVANQTAEFYRWKIKCPARKQLTFVVQERTYNWRTEMVLHQTYDRLREYLRQNWLDEKSLQQLKGVLDEQSQISQNQREISELEQQRGQLYQCQEQLRQNLTVLATSGEEAQLRRRVFEQLSESENRLNTIDGRIEELRADIKQRQQNLQNLLARLGKD